ncbi:MAG TPA: NADH-quinone oxidoreductase subunit M [Thermoanaerobaculia bacterium]|jgi:NADH-quinone oxidoreductase subunit M|nr:NADH-quinone oxidoreductase subunit M [Thermoanaerobaculia bacterium]
METFFGLLAGNTLTRLVFFPAIAAVPLFFLARAQATPAKSAKIYTLVVSLIELAFGLHYLFTHLGRDGTFPRVHDTVLTWLSSYGINYDLAMDGISMPLVLLGIFLVPIVILGSWKGIETHWPLFGASMLLLTTGVLGALLAYDLFLFYVFWEVMLVPMYLLIGIWGGERRIYAAVKFFLYTMAGSLLMLVAILWMAWTYHNVSGGVWSFAYEDLLRLDLPVHQQIWLFAAFALTFAIKVPMFPFHTWLPDAHVEAPTGGSVILAGILLKLGTYGFLRFALPLFPHASEAHRPLLLALAVIGILYGALVAWVQTDMKKLVAYSSIAHLGFVMLGLLAIDAVAWQGSLLQMVNHGLSTGALFLLVGMLYDRRHTKKFEEFGGLAKVMPVFAFFLVFSSLASVGLPALNGFVGEFMILTGSFRTLGWPVAVATFGVVLAAVYLLKMIQLTIWGPITKEENRRLSDLSGREVAALLPLCVLMLWIGVAPETFLRPSRQALEEVLTAYRQRVEEPEVAQATLRSVPAQEASR